MSRQRGKTEKTSDMMNPQLMAGKFLRCLFRKPGKTPSEIQVEITNRCNFNCPMCQRKELGVKDEDMPFDLFEEILLKLDNPRRLILTGWGEPLIHPDFCRMVQAVNKVYPEAGVCFTTNGFLLEGELADCLLKTRLEQVSISLDRLPGDEKVSTPGHIPAKKITDNLEAFLEKRGRDNLPRIRLQATIQPGSGDTLGEILEYAAKTGIDGVNLVRLQLPFSPGLVRPSQDEEKELLEYAGRLGKKLGVQVDSVRGLGPLLLLATGFDTFCIRLDDYAYITVDGGLAPCCNLRNHTAGSLRDSDLESLYSAPAIRDLWRSLGNPVCRQCDSFRYNYAGD
ncbi:MAG: radical SAM protein [Chloroflexi bacterium]|nr:radical SAM protein [Chloroflexota bacterium]